MSRLGDRVVWWVVTCGGLGAAPVAPGTFGALGGALLYGLASLAPDVATRYALAAAALLASCGATILCGRRAERLFGRKDAPGFVLDETAGLLLVALLCPLPAWSDPQPLPTLAAAFPAARLFDVVKPPPCRRLERLPAGWGVLLDDLAASLYAVAAIHAVASTASLVGG